MIPCEQAVTIAKIETTLGNMVTLLERHEDKDSRMLDAMETIARQTEAIKNITERDGRQDKEIDELYHLVREHLGQKSNPTLTCTILSGDYGKYIMLAIIIGTYIDIYSNWAFVKSIIALF